MLFSDSVQMLHLWRSYIAFQFKLLNGMWVKKKKKLMTYDLVSGICEAIINLQRIDFHVCCITTDPLISINVGTNQKD